MSQNKKNKDYEKLRQNSHEEINNLDNDKAYNNVENNDNQINQTTHRNNRPMKNQDSNSEVTSNNNNNSQNDIASSSTSIPEDPKLKQELDEYVEKQKELLSSPLENLTQKEYVKIYNEYKTLVKLYEQKKITPEQKEILNERYQQLAKFQYQHINPEQQKEYLNKQRERYKERKIKEAEQKKREMYENLRYYAKEISSIIRPVILCICLSILWVKLNNEQNDYQLTSQDLNLISGGGNNGDNSSSDNTEDNSEGFNIWKLLNSFANAGIIIGNIIIATFIILCLFKYNQTKILYGLFIFTVFMLVGIFGFNLAEVLIATYNIPMDWITLSIFMLNLSVVAVIVIFWKGPPRIQQGYLILMSSLMAFSLTGLADYTTWFLLALLACWDLIAVLCPFGPLKMLVEHSDSNKQMIPQALIYSTMVWMMAQDVRIKVKDNNNDDENKPKMELTHNPSALFDECEASSSCSTKELIDSKQKKLNEINNDFYKIKVNEDEDSDISNSNSDQINESGNEDGDNLEKKNLTNSRRGSKRTDHDNNDNNNREGQDNNTDDDDDEGLKLGLGDFVFYSVLISRAAMHDWLTTFSCAIAVLTGLTLTIFLLSIYQKALPALPISIVFGIIFYIFSSSMLGPLIKYLTRVGIAEKNMQDYTDLTVDVNNGCSFVYL